MNPFAENLMISDGPYYLDVAGVCRREDTV